MVPHAYNADGGTISVYIGPTLLISYSFGAVTSLTQTKYAILSTNCVPAVSGSQTLSIHFSRGYGTDADTPSDYIDNISLTRPVPPTLNIRLLAGNVVLTWTNAAYGLQAAPSLIGAYTNITSSASPYTDAITGPSRFFRLIGKLEQTIWQETLPSRLATRKLRGPPPSLGLKMSKNLAQTFKTGGRAEGIVQG